MGKLEQDMVVRNCSLRRYLEAGGGVGEMEINTGWILDFQSQDFLLKEIEIIFPPLREQGRSLLASFELIEELIARIEHVSESGMLKEVTD